MTVRDDGYGGFTVGPSDHVVTPRFYVAAERDETRFYVVDDVEVVEIGLPFDTEEDAQLEADRLNDIAADYDLEAWPS